MYAALTKSRLHCFEGIVVCLEMTRVPAHGLTYLIHQRLSQRPERCIITSNGPLLLYLFKAAALRRTHRLLVPGASGPKRFDGKLA
jgi:hypothetical protein